jgi:hypothetical protein
VVIFAAGAGTSAATARLGKAGLQMPAAPESLAILAGMEWGVQTIWAVGADGLGLAYALTELADRVKHSPMPFAALKEATLEQPSNKWRGIIRVFVSEEEDKPWFYDWDGWKQYFDMLVTQRFNRFNLSMGLAYDFSTRVSDAYFFFAYPFLVKVPGYDVKAIKRGGTPLPEEEREKNLDTIRFISKEAAKRGIHFQLGLWTHSIAWPATANYTIAGITSATQAAYSRDALHTLLEACPDVKGVTIRTHGESGVPEGNEGLWKMIFSGATGLSGGRKVQLDLHAKGLTFEMVDNAVATGLPVVITPKFWAEHMGLPYMQSSIREWEKPQQADGARDRTGLMAVSTGTRSHLRYGYGDLLTNDRKYGVIHRVFPGTQRVLLWGDPVFGRAYGRAFTFPNCDGVEFFEPLAFKGRQGSGAATHNRGCYADPSLRQPKGLLGGQGEMGKYEYTFRLWGRLAYNPDADADIWTRFLKTQYGAIAGQMEKALGLAGRILPLITTAHSPSAAQANFWPEIYSNQSIHDENNPQYADDTPSPKIFTTVSSLDPQLFANSQEQADALLEGKPLGKIGVTAVADQLETWADACTGILADLQSSGVGRNNAATRRAMVDCRIASAVGQFFALKFRAALCYAIFDRSGHEPARVAALDLYDKAGDAWMDAVKAAEYVYITDIAFGQDDQIRRDWKTRMPRIDADIASMRTAKPRATEKAPVAPQALSRALAQPASLAMAISHVPPSTFTAGDAIPVTLRLTGSAPTAVRFWYRHVNQAESYQSFEMESHGDAFTATIPAAYTKSQFDVQYYFEITQADQSALYPGFREDFVGTPYFIVRQK